MTPDQTAAELLHVWDDQTDRQPATLKTMIAAAIREAIQQLEIENKCLRATLKNALEVIGRDP